MAQIIKIKLRKERKMQFSSFGKSGHFHFKGKPVESNQNFCGFFVTDRPQELIALVERRP